MSVICLAHQFTAHAGVIDLTTDGSSTWKSGAFFLQWNDAPTGQGLIDPFVQIHAQEQHHPQEGYNTDGALELDTETGHAIQLQNIPIATIGGSCPFS